MILLLLTKAEMVERNDGLSIRSVSQSFPFPSVIRLANYIRVPYKKIELTRKNILRRDGMACQYCGTRSPELTVDHIIPKSRGGIDSWENMVAACRECNNKKGNRSPEEAGMRLRTKPKKPNHIIFIQQTIGKVEENWRRFLFMD